MKHDTNLSWKSNLLLITSAGLIMTGLWKWTQSDEIKQNESIEPKQNESIALSEQKQNESIALSEPKQNESITPSSLSGTQAPSSMALAKSDSIPTPPSRSSLLIPSAQPASETNAESSSSEKSSPHVRSLPGNSRAGLFYHSAAGSFDVLASCAPSRAPSSEALDTPPNSPNSFPHPYELTKLAAEEAAKKAKEKRITTALDAIANSNETSWLPWPFRR